MFFDEIKRLYYIAVFSWKNRKWIDSRAKRKALEKYLREKGVFHWWI